MQTSPQRMRVMRHVTPAAANLSRFYCPGRGLSTIFCPRRQSARETGEYAPRVPRALLERLGRLQRVGRTGLDRLLENQQRLDADFQQILDEGRVIDIARSEDLRPDTVSRLAQVQLRDAPTVQLENIEEGHLRIAGAAIDPVLGPVPTIM